MTIITVTTPRNRLDTRQRAALALSLTDAVLVPEVGQAAPPARIGFQVHFVELSAEHMAIGGKLLVDHDTLPDVATIDICVMDAAWPVPVRRQVIDNVLAAVAKACDLAEAPSRWWVNFRVIEEGSWGSRGGVLSILDLLDERVFTAERITAVRANLNA